MRATQAWITIVVAAALAAGMLAFLVATPNEGSRIGADEAGFRSLNSHTVFGGFGHAAEHHRSAHAATVGSRAASVAGRRWLANLAGSSGRRAPVPANVKPATGRVSGPRHVAAFVRWADELPARRWRVTANDAVPLADAERTWTVSAEVQVDVAQSVSRTRRQVVPVELEFRGSEAEASDGSPARWVVEDITVAGGSAWLRAYTDPIVVGTGTVDVVAPSSARQVAADAAATASAALAPVATRYTTRGGVASLAIWMVERPARVRAVTQRMAPADVRTAEDTSTHKVAWADERGDVVVDLSRFQSLTASARAGAIRHAVAHVATASATTKASALLAEGLALAEERRSGDAIVLSRTELDLLDDAFGSRTTGIADLLVAPPGGDLDTNVQQAAAAATVAWLLEERGAKRTRALLAALQDGVPATTALRRTVGLAPRGVELGVAAWVRGKLPAVPAPDRSSPTEDPEETAP